MSVLEVKPKNVPYLDPAHLSSFVAIAETGNLTKAADAVFRTPSAISMQIKKLEQTLGSKILHRTSREVSLTKDGERFLPYARQLLALNLEAFSEFREPALEGRVRIGAPDDFGERLLPDILKKLAIRYPMVSVDVVIDQSFSLHSSFDEGALDVVICTGGSAKNLGSEYKLVLEERLVWAGLKEGCAFKKRPLPVSMWEDCCTWRQAAVTALTKAEIPYRTAFRSASTTGQKAALVADLAIAPFPRSIITSPLIELREADTGLPELNTYKILLAYRKKAGKAAEIAANEIEHAFRCLPGNMLS